MKALRRICAAALGIASFAAAAITVLVNWPDFWAMYGEGLQGGWRGFLGLFYDHGLAIGMASALALGVGIGLMFAHRPHAPADPAQADKAEAIARLKLATMNQKTMLKAAFEGRDVYTNEGDWQLLWPAGLKEMFEPETCRDGFRLVMRGWLRELYSTDADLRAVFAEVSDDDIREHTYQRGHAPFGFGQSDIWWYLLVDEPVEYELKRDTTMSVRDALGF